MRVKTCNLLLFTGNPVINKNHSLNVTKFLYLYRKYFVT